MVKSLTHTIKSKICVSTCSDAPPAMVFYAIFAKSKSLPNPIVRDCTLHCNFVKVVIQSFQIIIRRYLGKFFSLLYGKYLF